MWWPDTRLTKYYCIAWHAWMLNSKNLRVQRVVFFHQDTFYIIPGSVTGSDQSRALFCGRPIGFQQDPGGQDECGSQWRTLPDRLETAEQPGSVILFSFPALITSSLAVCPICSLNTTDLNTFPSTDGGRLVWSCLTNLSGWVQHSSSLCLDQSQITMLRNVLAYLAPEKSCM